MEALSDALRFEVAGFGIKVVLVEPGLITTNFDAKAAAEMAEYVEGDGPYTGFNTSVMKATTEVYDGPMAKLGGPPESVRGHVDGFRIVVVSLLTGAWFGR